MKGLSKDAASQHEIGEDADGQRIDNYLARILKGVPRAHVYRILRSGEVRVNSRRVDADHRLALGDRIRVPPIRTAAPAPVQTGRKAASIRIPVLYEDEAILAIDKPAGLAVHGGSGIALGAIEALRAQRPEARFLELVHRLDRDTSGVLLVAKKRSALTALHAQLREGRVGKRYLALAAGTWRHGRRAVKEALAEFTLASGERRVRVQDDGRYAHTDFSLVKPYEGYSLLAAELKTGRTHQIRVHLQHLGHPIVGDAKYGDYERNRALVKRGFKRMFLHAARVAFEHPVSKVRTVIESPLPAELQAFLDGLPAKAATA
ncbi:MAG: RluA family pseudouridine synthase [Burkholderiales bacterium]